MKDIFKISKDEKRAKALKEMAQDRFDNMNFEKPYRIIEEYYEIIKELITAFMYKKGWKTLSHKILVEYAAKNIKSLSQREIQLIDELRVTRNNIVYYGEKISSEFIKSREKSIKQIINKLLAL